MEDKELLIDEVVQENIVAENITEDLVGEEVSLNESLTDAESEVTLTEQEAIVSEENSEEVVEEVQLSEKELRILQAKENAKWYVLHTFSGYENVAKENLEIVIEKYNLYERIFDIVIPMEDAIEEKDGKRKLVTRKVMPGYILVKMNYGDDIWHAVTRTRGITGFVGPKGRPLHLTEDEIRKMQLEKNVVADISILVNDKVEVLEGPLNGFSGVVISVDAISHKCRVVVEMFGRETPVDLSLTQIRKIG